MTTTKLSITSNTCVMVRCNACGCLFQFFPIRVMNLRECHCGNDDWGSPRYWEDREFGNFSFIRAEEQVFGFHLSVPRKEV